MHVEWDRFVKIERNDSPISRRYAFAYRAAFGAFASTFLFALSVSSCSSSNSVTVPISPGGSVAKKELQEITLTDRKSSSTARSISYPYFSQEQILPNSIQSQCCDLARTRRGDGKSTQLTIIHTQRAQPRLRNPPITTPGIEETHQPDRHALGLASCSTFRLYYGRRE